MENSDSSDDEHDVGRKASRSKFGAPDIYPTTSTSRRSVAQSSHSHSHSRRSSAPLPQPSMASPEKGSRQSHSIAPKPSRRSLGTPRSQQQQQPPSRRAAETPRRSLSGRHERRSSHDRYEYDTHPTHHRDYHYHSSRSTTKGSPALGPSLDEEDPEQKKIRWEAPTTHSYQLTEQPRLLEERFMNVLDAMPNMVCSQGLIEKPLTGGANLVWSLIDANRRTGKDESNKETGTGDSNSQGQSSDSGDDSIFEDGPSVVEISTHPPVFSESITASESLLNSESSDEERNDNDGGHSSASYSLLNDPNNPPADSSQISQILDDLSGMESERKVVEYDNAPRTLPAKDQEPIVVNNSNNLPPVKIYSTSMPFEMKKEKQCLLSIGKFQDRHKGRSNAASARKQYEMNKKEELAHKKRLKDHPNVPPIPDISVGESHEVSTMSASEDSFMYHSKGKQTRHDHRNQKQERATNPVDAIPENQGLPVEAANPKILFDNSFQDETRSCMPSLLQRKRRGADGGTASSSSRSMGLRLLSRSGDANTTSEKEDEDKDEEASPYVYEYEAGVNTYVAYFETTKSKEVRAALQVIEHPNPPLLPFGSNEVVVKIEVSRCFYLASQVYVVIKSWSTTNRYLPDTFFPSFQLTNCRHRLFRNQIAPFGVENGGVEHLAFPESLELRLLEESTKFTRQDGMACKRVTKSCPWFVLVPILAMCAYLEIV